MVSNYSFIERALEYGMQVWLDLMANHNNHLGRMEKYEKVVTPETATYVVKQIAKQYDSRVWPSFLIPPTFICLNMLGCDGSHGASGYHFSHNTCGSNAAGFHHD